ncbi:MAG: heme synthase, CtaA [Francisellaceae bacterium]|nr:heme synthase, CtaA [Francisellaceae bacterium]
MYPSTYSSYDWQKKILILTILMAFSVVLLGAYTRLKDAGLGCPDWPGCFGYWRVPETQAQALFNFPNHILESNKAHIEMLHRYMAGGLGVIILGLSILKMVFKTKSPFSLPLLTCLLLTILFQAILGMWTVTMKLLPIVVVAHLSGGFLTITLLWLQYLKLNLFSSKLPLRTPPAIRLFGILALVMLIIQILLGGWTSANYAALVCPDFPYCAGKWIPPLELMNSFNPLTAAPPGSLNSLSYQARVSIHFIHRLNALATFSICLIFGILILKRFKSKRFLHLTFLMISLLFIQITLGILNVLYGLPLIIALAHNGIALLLLLNVLTINFYLPSSAYAKKII